MACGGTLLSAEYSSDCEYAFKSSNHNLLVELGRGGKIRCLIVEVLDLENGRATFRVAPYQSRCLEVGEALADERGSVCVDDGCLHAEDIAVALASERVRPIVETGINVKFRVLIERQLVRLGEHLNTLDLKLNISVLFVGLYVLLGALVHDAGHPDDVFATHLFGGFHKCIVSRKDDTLDVSGTVTEIEKDQLPLVTTHVHPAAQIHRLADVIAELPYQYPFHIL